MRKLRSILQYFRIFLFHKCISIYQYSIMYKYLLQRIGLRHFYILRFWRLQILSPFHQCRKHVLFVQHAQAFAKLRSWLLLYYCPKFVNIPTFSVLCKRCTDFRKIDTSTHSECVTRYLEWKINSKLLRFKTSEVNSYLWPLKISRRTYQQINVSLKYT